MRKHPKFEGIFLKDTEYGQKIFTRNFDEGKTIYDETLVFEKDIEYREWNPYRSKLAAAIIKKARNIYISHNTRCLYLGASSGTTVSHISDITIDGIIFAVEFAPRSIRELIQNCKNRKNIIPIMGDANQPEKYAKFVYGEIGLIYMDIAQPNQAEIAIKNCKKFLQSGGILIMAIKARSINVTMKPKEVFKKVFEKLKEMELEILEKMDIAPFTKDHLIIFARYFEQ